MFGSSSGALRTFSRLCSIVTKPPLTLSTASTGIRKCLSPIPRCPQTVTAHLPVGLVDQKVPHVADKVVVGVGDGTVDQVARHEKDVRPLTCLFYGSPPRIRVSLSAIVPRAWVSKRLARLQLHPGTRDLR